MFDKVPMRSAWVVHEYVDDSDDMNNVRPVAINAYIREATAGAYGTDFISSPFGPDVQQSR